MYDEFSTLFNAVEDSVKSGFYRATVFKSQSDDSLFDILALETKSVHGWKFYRAITKHSCYESHDFVIDGNMEARVILKVSADLTLSVHLQKWGYDDFLECTRWIDTDPINNFED